MERIELLRAKDILVWAEALLSAPRSWTRQAYARTASGRVVESRNPAARRYSLAGAVFRARHLLESGEGLAYQGRALKDLARAWDIAEDRALVAVARALPFPRPPQALRALNEWNDRRARSKRAVQKALVAAMAAIDEQIDHLEQLEPAAQA
jgi:hypothetical protein